MDNNEVLCYGVSIRINKHTGFYFMNNAFTYYSIYQCSGGEILIIELYHKDAGFIDHSIGICLGTYEMKNYYINIENLHIKWGYKIYSMYATGFYIDSMQNNVCIMKNCVYNDKMVY